MSIHGVGRCNGKRRREEVREEVREEEEEEEEGYGHLTVTRTQA
jgi:hypothetical protein